MNYTSSRSGCDAPAATPAARGFCISGTAVPFPFSKIEATDATRVVRSRVPHAANADRTQTGDASMETLDELKARLRSRLSSTHPADRLSTPTGHRPDQESMATLNGESEERPMPHAAHAGEANMLPTCTGLLQDEESMPTLTDEIKTFIVKGLACYDTPSQVAEAVKVNFGVEISRQHVYAYDPNSSQQMAPRWRELHAATRQALLRDLAEIGVAHRAARLRMLDRLAHRCERNSVALALACLEQAAKECGGIYENRRPVVLQLPMPQLPVPQPAAPELSSPPNGPDGLIASMRLRQLPELRDAAAGVMDR